MAQARTALATDLKALAITTPEAMSIRAVHETPVSALSSEMLPCFILPLPGLRAGPNGGLNAGYAEETWAFLAGLFVAHDSHNGQWSGQVLSSFMQAVLTRFYARQTLGGAAFFINDGSPRIVPANAELFAGIQYPHVDFEFDITVGGPVTTGA